MSRIGKKPIYLPSGVLVKITEDSVNVKGPKGESTLVLHAKVIVAEKVNDEGSAYLEVTVKNPDEDSAIWGTMRSLLEGMVKGVTEGWTKTLELNGVGFKMNVSGQTLKMSLGFSHDIEYVLPEGIAGTIEGNILTIFGIDKMLVGKVASEIRALKKPEPYKGKGFRYTDELVRRKVGKAAKTE